MSWIFLLAAGLLEAVWAIGLKYTDGFTRLIPSVIVGSAIVGSLFFLSLAVRHIPIGTGYAIWVSIGILGAATAGPLLFNEPLRPLQCVFLGLLLVAIAGLKLSAHPN